MNNCNKNICASRDKKGRICMKNYYNYSPKEVRKQINNSYEPLTAMEVKQNQEKYGKRERKLKRVKKHFP